MGQGWSGVYPPGCVRHAFCRVGKRSAPTVLMAGAVAGCRVGKRSAPTARFRGRVDGKYATAVKSFRSPSRCVYMCLFLTRTCKGGSPPPPLQSRLPAENRPCGEAVPYSLRPRVGHDNTSLYCHALAPGPSGASRPAVKRRGRFFKAGAKPPHIDAVTYDYPTCHPLNLAHPLLNSF